MLQSYTERLSVHKQLSERPGALLLRGQNVMLAKAPTVRAAIEFFRFRNSLRFRTCRQLVGSVRFGSAPTVHSNCLTIV